VSEVSPGHLFKFQQLLKKIKKYWPPKLQLYGPPYILEMMLQPLFPLIMA
jgi:hypothetical protein